MKGLFLKGRTDLQQVTRRSRLKTRQFNQVRGEQWREKQPFIQPPWCSSSDPWKVLEETELRGPTHAHTPHLALSLPVWSVVPSSYTDSRLCPTMRIFTESCWPRENSCPLCVCSLQPYVWDFPGSPEVKNLPCNAGGTDLIPGQGTKIPHAPEQLSPHTTITECSVQFSCSVVSNSLRPHGLQHARPPCPSSTPGVYSDSCSSSQWCHPTLSSSVVPFSSHSTTKEFVHPKEDPACRNWALMQPN